MIKQIKNFFFCLKYPFMRARNVWTDKPCGYSYTWYDSIPKGWQRAFGKKLCKDLKVALKKDKYLYKFRFIEIKEKWGSLCLYNSGCSKEVNKIISYYEELSKAYCINCGKPVRYITSGWISYICEQCAIDYIFDRSNIDKKDFDSIYNKLDSMRLTKDDISTWKCADKEMQDLYDSFNWNKLWGLDKDGK